MSNSDFIWVEKYRPTFSDILPDDTKKTFQSFLDRGDTKYVTCRSSEDGKTTVAKALCNLTVDYYVINGSDEGRFLDTVRNNAKSFRFDRLAFFRCKTQSHHH